LDFGTVDTEWYFFFIFLLDDCLNDEKVHVRQL